MRVLSVPLSVPFLRSVIAALIDGRLVKGFEARSNPARLAEATVELLAGSPERQVDAHAIQPFYTGILARDCGLALSAAVEGEAVVVSAR